MRIPKNDEGDESIIDVSPLIDIMFILIIFFMVTMTVNEEERDITVNLPNTDKSLSSAPKAIVINIRKDGSYFFGPRRMKLEGIESELSMMLDSNPNQKVLIRGDKEALHGNVAAAIATCKKVGINDANIGYKATQ